ncbi:hypothetical protein pb186bvf_011097 [Paramecium bursaria]
MNFLPVYDIDFIQLHVVKIVQLTDLMYQHKTIDHYNYLTKDVIGRGFSSTVYKGWDSRSGDLVAIKIINKNLQTAVQNVVIQNELNTLSQLKGKHILKLYDWFTTTNNLYIITEFCDKGDLEEYLKLNQLQPGSCANVIRQVLDGLLSMQKQNFIHRDLKPSNIFLTTKMVKLGDFGFAKQLDKLQNEMNLGTPLYMSPETLIHNQYNAKSDVWSLGVLFYQLLYRHPPWNVQTEADLKVAMFQPIYFPSNPDVTDQMKDLIYKALTIDVNMRASVQELIQHPLFAKKKQIRIEHVNQNAQCDVVRALVRKPVQCEDVIFNQIEYCLFIREILNSFNERELMKFLREKLIFTMLKHIYFISQKIFRQFQTNIMNLPDWDEFKTTQRFQNLQVKYEQFLNENIKLSQKYTIKLKCNQQFYQDIQVNDEEFFQLFTGADNNDFTWHLQQILKLTIIELNHKIQEKMSINYIQLDDLNSLVPQQYWKDLYVLELMIQYHHYVQKYKCFTQHQEQIFSEYSGISSRTNKNKQYTHNAFLEIRCNVKFLMSE